MVRFVDVVIIGQSGAESGAESGTMRVTGSLSCDAVHNCYLGCRAGDQSCIRGCIDQGTEEAQDDFSEMLSCMEFDCRRDPECYGNTCKVEMQTCLGERQGPTPNSLSCGGALTCLLRCNSISLQCRQNDSNIISILEKINHKEIICPYHHHYESA